MSFYQRQTPMTPGLENMGKAWKDEELLQLLKEVKSQMTKQDIATAHKRTVGGIISRLKSLAADYYLNDSKPINEIMVITGLPKDVIIDAISKKEYRDELKDKKAKENKVSEEDILSKTLKTKPNESSELQEILILLKSIEARVEKYVKEKSIFDE